MPAKPSFPSLFLRFAADCRGGLAIEYVLIAAAVVISIAAVVHAMGVDVADMYNDVQGAFLKAR